MLRNGHTSILEENINLTQTLEYYLRIRKIPILNFLYKEDNIDFEYMKAYKGLNNLLMFSVGLRKLKLLFLPEKYYYYSHLILCSCYQKKTRFSPNIFVYYIRTFLNELNKDKSRNIFFNYIIRPYLQIYLVHLQAFIAVSNVNRNKKEPILNKVKEKWVKLSKKDQE